MEANALRSKAEEAYLLDWDLAVLGDEDYLAYLVEFPGSEDIVTLSSTSAYSLPSVIYFIGNVRKLETLDYPYTNVRWPLMSRQMISVLRSVGPFESREIAVTILDDTIPKARLFPKSGKINHKHALHGFVGVQLLQHLDVFDWDRSEYERSENSPSRVRDISKLVLKVPPGGFPPLFRVSAARTLLFVSGAARQALEDAKVTGVRFADVDDYPLAN